MWTLTRNMFSMFMWIVPLYIHACWCSIATSSHSSDFAIFDVILAPSKILHPHLIMAQWCRWSPSMMLKDLSRKFFTNSQWFISSPSIPYLFNFEVIQHVILNDEYQPFEICFFKMKNVMSPPTCRIIPLHAKAATKVVDPTSTPSHHSRSLSYDRRTMPFIDVERGVC